MRFLLLFFALLTLTACEDTKKQSEASTPSAVSKKVDTTAKKPEKTQTKDLRTQALPLLTEATADSILRAYGKDNPETRAKITTKYGEIEIELFKDTPVHRANFVYLVKEGYFDNTYFHRVVPNFIIQAGNSDNADTNRKRAKLANTDFLPSWRTDEDTNAALFLGPNGIERIRIINRQPMNSLSF